LAQFDAFVPARQTYKPKGNPKAQKPTIRVSAHQTQRFAITPIRFPLIFDPRE